LKLEFGVWISHLKNRAVSAQAALKHAFQSAAKIALKNGLMIATPVSVRTTFF
jgi:hypothetical protein